MAELKRLNNLMTDQDIHARRRLKIPTKKHGILEELAQQDHAQTQAGSTCSVEEALDAGAESDSSGSTIVRTVSISKQSKDAKKFLKQMDRDIKSIVDSTVTRHQNLDEVTNRLTCRRFYPLEPAKANYGATWGLTFRSLIIVLVLIFTITPFLVFMYCSSENNNCFENIRNT